MAKYFARKALCAKGHNHDSKQEASRCALLHERLARGEITGLVYAPRYVFEIGGTPVRLLNGHKAGYKADFAYIENGRVVVEDVKPKNKGYGESRDVPLRHAIFRHLNPTCELRIVR